MQTLLTSGDNPRIIKKIAKFNAGGVVPPRLATACPATKQFGGLNCVAAFVGCRGSWKYYASGVEYS